MMNVIYNSENYYMVEYPDQHAYELVDKRTARSTYFQGDVAAMFMKSVLTAVAEDASFEHIDKFLSSFDVVLNLPIAIH